MPKVNRLTQVIIATTDSIAQTTAGNIKLGNGAFFAHVALLVPTPQENEP